MRIEFSRPELLYLLALLPLWILLVWPRASRGVLFTRGDSGAPRSWGGAALVQAAPRILRGVALASLLVALAGPERVETVE